MKVGDYVRTKDGRIDKIESIHNGLYVLENFPYSCNEHWLIKSSANIIDLIEVGDYVNGVMVTEIKDGKPFKEDYNDPYYSYYIDDIYSIVTKEQFSQMEYRIEEK